MICFHYVFPYARTDDSNTLRKHSDNCLGDEDNDLFLDLSCEKALFPAKTFLFCSYTRACGT